MEFVKKFTPPDFRQIILHRQFHLISSVRISTVRKNTKSEWKWRNLHRWQKNYTATGSDKSHLCVKVPCQCSQLISKFCPVATTVVISIWYEVYIMNLFRRTSFWTLFPFPLRQSSGPCVGWEETLVSTCSARLQRDPRDAARWFATVWSSYVATKSDKKRPTRR